MEQRSIEYLTAALVRDRLNAGEINLNIKDDGIGVPQDFNFHKSDSLVLRLVRILTRQLEGEIELGFSRGAGF